MGVELVRVGKYLDASIESYGKTFFEELRKKEAEEEYDEEELQKNRWSMVALQKVNKDLLYPSEYQRFHIIQELLMQNNSKGFNTQIQFMDGEEFIITPDMLVDFEDGYLIIFNRDEYLEDPTVIPTKEALINLVNVRELHTLHENNDEVVGD